MTRWWMILTVATVIAGAKAQAADQFVPGSRLALLYDSLSHPVPDPDRAADVSDILLMRGGQEILLSKGTLRLFRPVNGRVWGAVFTGTGEFTLYVPNASEREEFTRQTELGLTEDRYRWKFTRAAFWFHDTLLAELGTGLSFGPREVSNDELVMTDRSRRYATEVTNENIPYRLLVEMLEPESRPFLLAHFGMPDKKEVLLRYDHRRFEEVALYRPPYEGITGSVWWLELVNSFHLLEEYADASEYALSGENKNRFDWASSVISVAAEKSGDLRGRSEVTVRERGGRRRILEFLLDPELVLDSVTAPGGERVEYHRLDDAWEGAILLPESAAGEWRLTFWYSGEYLWLVQGLRRIAGMIYTPRSSASTTGWYPAPPAMDRMTFDVTYDVPSDLTVVAAGHPSADSVSGDRRINRYVTSEPDLICSFTLGYFDKESHRLSDSESVVTVYDVGTANSEEVGKDCANSMRLYTALFGPPPFRDLRVTGGPMTHGQAFQEFIHLPWFDEIVGEGSSTMALGRAHEVAHAWWGHAVGWASYHDQWLSEAFANYSALLYAPFVLKKEDEFFDKLRDWKERINGARKYSLGAGAQLGSIWLGYRTSSSQTRGDYSLSTYIKGAWVIHMLRMMLFDLTTRSEDRFKALMRDFYAQYNGKDPTTQDFMALTGKHFGGDMRWFFDQWVYGTEIPTLLCTKSGARTPEGTYELKLRVEQRDVSKPFILYLPFEIRYADGTLARARLSLSKASQEFSYTLEREPEAVTFNILESLLCPVEE